GRVEGAAREVGKGHYHGDTSAWPASARQVEEGVELVRPSIPLERTAEETQDRDDQSVCEMEIPRQRASQVLPEAHHPRSVREDRELRVDPSQLDHDHVGRTVEIEEALE